MRDNPNLTQLSQFLFKVKRFVDVGGLELLALEQPQALPHFDDRRSLGCQRCACQSLTDDINAGKGAIGTLTKDQEFAKKLQDTMGRLNEITTRLNNGEGSAGKFLRDPSFYDNTNHLLTESQSLVQAIRQNPKKYLTIYLKIF